MAFTSWEGWTAEKFIEELAPQVKTIMAGESWRKPFNSKAELKKWCTENQPFYKKPIPAVYNHFAKIYNLR
jgi:hypothetical protein